MPPENAGDPKLQRWVDLVASLLARNYPATFSQLAADVPAYVNELAEIEFSFQDAVDRTKIPGYQDTTFHDRIFSAYWVQSFFDKNYFIQPYVKAGAGQLEREASGSYGDGVSPPSKVGSLTAVLGGGFKFYLTRTFAIRAELTSYLAGGKIGSWQDNYNITYGFSYLF